MNKINQIVDAMLKQHTGGEIFFDNLDESFKQKDIIEITREKVNELIEQYNIDYIIVSGGFGSVFSYFNPDMNNLICVEGGLRGQNEISDCHFKEKDMDKSRFLFLDDSYYLGRTKNKIEQAINKLGGELVRVFVLYDGSKEHNEIVESFYQYYDKEN